MRSTIACLLTLAALAFTPGVAEADGGPCEALLAQLNERYQDLGGDLAPRTKEFKALRRGHKHLNQWSNQFQKQSNCTTSLINHPWNGTALGITLRITCPKSDPGDPPNVTNLRFDITKVG